MHPYASRQYARAFAGLYEVLEVEALGAFVLRRPIPAGGADAMGAYPVATFAPSADFGAAFRTLREAGLVSLVLVPDAFSGPGPEVLERVFDLVRPFKTHYAHDYATSFCYDKHHRYEVKRARAACEVAVVDYDSSLGRWIELYAELVARHGISGLRRFSTTYFERLGELPGLYAIAARTKGRVVAMHLFVEHAGVVYSHLAAADEEGYLTRGGYAVNDFAIEYFRGRRLIDFGAGAGTVDDPTDGLAVFKRGFANRAEPFLLCGKVLDRTTYERLAADRRAGGYFPAYREAT